MQILDKASQGQNPLASFASKSVTVSGVPFLGKLLALHSNIRPCWKGWPVTKTLAILGSSWSCLLDKAGKACQGQTLKLIDVSDVFRDSVLGQAPGHT